MIEFKTSLGDFSNRTVPQRSAHQQRKFPSLRHAGFFDGTIFHRVIPGFVLQGGGFTRTCNRKNNEPSRMKPARPEEQTRHVVHGAHQ